MSQEETQTTEQTQETVEGLNINDLNTLVDLKAGVASKSKSKKDILPEKILLNILRIRKRWQTLYIHLQKKVG